MAVDIWSVWSKPHVTPDIVTVPHFDYDADESFAKDVMQGEDKDESDVMVTLKTKKLLELKKKWEKDEDIVKVIDKWLEMMAKEGQSWIRLVINF